MPLKSKSLSALSAQVGQRVVVADGAFAYAAWHRWRQLRTVRDNWCGDVTQLRRKKVGFWVMKGIEEWEISAEEANSSSMWF